MVRRTDVDMFIITAGSYAAPAMIGTSSPLDGAPAQRRWLHLHRRMVRRPGVASYIITVGRYAGPASMDASSPPDGTPDGGKGCIITAGWYAAPVVVRYRHCRMVCRTDGGKIPSPPARNRRS